MDLKCKCMVLSRRDVILPTYVIRALMCPLETVTTFLDLGVLVDMKLSFIDRISMVIGKARAWFCKKKGIHSFHLLGLF